MSLVPNAPPLTARPRPLLLSLQVFNVICLLTGWVMPCPSVPRPPPQVSNIIHLLAGQCLLLCARHLPLFPPPQVSNVTHLLTGRVMPSLSLSLPLCAKLLPLFPPPQVPKVIHLLTGWVMPAPLCQAPPTPPPSGPPPQVSNNTHLLTGWVMPCSPVSSPCPLHHPRFPTSLTC